MTIENILMKRGTVMFDQNEPGQKQRWWDRLDGHMWFIISCAGFGLLLIIKGVVGILTGR